MLGTPTRHNGWKIQFQQCFKTILSTQKEWRTKVHRTLPLNLLRWYHKDRSKTNEGTGAEVAESMGIFPSIFQADVYTIERCVENKSGQVLQWSIHCNLVR